MFKKALPFLGLAAVLALVAFLLSYQSDLSGTYSGTTDGATVFRETCSQCHGFQGEGVVNITPPLRGREISVEEVKSIVRNGRLKMPPLSFIRGEALENVAKYVSGLK